MHLRDHKEKKMTNICGNSLGMGKGKLVSVAILALGWGVDCTQMHKTL
jgi:hypothetical protein